MDTLVTALPFEGFYESRYSGEIDHIEEMEADNAAERQDEDGIPKELRLDASDFAQILFDTTDYSAAYRDTSKAYVDAFDHVASEFTGIPLGLKWESMDSPREYNFTTDRVYAHIAADTVRALFAKSAEDGHKALAEAIKERFTSRSGFISGYSNRLPDWLERDVVEWDHNELCTLIIAALAGFEDSEGERVDWAVYNRVVDCDGLYNEWSNAVDWPKYEAAVAEKREELAEELRADDPDYVAPPVRCDQTVDMFTGRAG